MASQLKNTSWKAHVFTLKHSSSLGKPLVPKESQETDKVPFTLKGSLELSPDSGPQPAPREAVSFAGCLSFCM